MFVICALGLKILFVVVAGVVGAVVEAAGWYDRVGWLLGGQKGQCGGAMQPAGQQASGAWQPVHVRGAPLETRWRKRGDI